MELSALQLTSESDDELKRKLSILFQKYSREWIKRSSRDAPAAGVPLMDYHWQFSEAYPRFPLPASFDVEYVPKELPFWKRKDVISCIEALTNGDLKFTTKQQMVLPQDRSSAPTAEITAAMSLVSQSSSEPATQTARAPASHGHAINEELAGKEKNLMEIFKTIMDQASTIQRELERCQEDLEQSRKELKHHLQQEPLKLEAAYEDGRNMSLELVLGKKEQREQVLTEKLSASVAKSRSLEIENRELRDEVEALRGALKDVLARPIYRDEMALGFGGSSGRCHQEETATSLSAHDIHAKYYGIGSWPDEPNEIKGDPGSLSTQTTINERIKALDEPFVSLVPSLMRRFPIDFVQRWVGGDYSLMTSTNSAAEPVVEWQQIHVDPSFHKRCPTRLKNGALVHVVGCPGIETGQTYALWRIENPGFTKYIGHYKITEKVIMPFMVWKQQFSQNMRKSLVKDLINNSWGRNLLHSKGIAEMGEAEHENIVKLFESEKEPRLRMFWSVLKFDSFQLISYNKLLRAANLPGPAELPTSSSMGFGEKLSHKRPNEEYSAPSTSPTAPQTCTSQGSRTVLNPDDPSVGAGRAESMNDSIGSYSPVAKRSRLSGWKKGDVKEEDVEASTLITIPDSQGSSETQASQEPKDIVASQDVTEF